MNYYLTPKRAITTILILSVWLITLQLGSFLIAEPSKADSGVTWLGQGGWEHNSIFGERYNVKKRVEYSGKILSISEISPLGGMTPGIKLTINSKDGDIFNAYLGPSWFVLHQNMSLKVGQKVTVKGPFATFKKERAMMCDLLIQGRHMLRLRNKNGAPLWGSWKRRVGLK